MCCVGGSRPAGVLYVLFTEVTVEPVEVVKDTNESRKSICGVIWHASISKLHGGRRQSMKLATEAACCMLHAEAGSAASCRVECLGASGEHTYVLGCVRDGQRGQAMQC